MSTVQRPTPPSPVSDPGQNTATSGEPELIRRQREAYRAVLALVADRAETEARVGSTHATADANADRDYAVARKALADKINAQKEADRRADEERRRAIIDAAIAGEATAKSEFGRDSRRIASDFDAHKEAARNNYTREKLEAGAAFEAAEKASSRKYAEERKPIDDSANINNTFRERLAALFADYKKFGLTDPPTNPTRETYEKLQDPVDALFDRLTKVEKPLSLLEGLVIPKAVKGNRWVWLFVLFFLLLIYPLIQLQGPAMGAGFALGGAVVFGLLARFGLYNLSKKQVSHLFDPLSQSVVDADALANYCRGQAKARYDERKAQNTAKRDADLAKAKQKHADTITAGENNRDERLRKINEVYAQRMVEIQTRQQLDLRTAIETHEKLVADHSAVHEAATRKLDEKYQGLKTRVRTQYETEWQALCDRWHSGLREARATLDLVEQAADPLGPRWDSPAWNDRPFPKAVPPVLRCGDIVFGLESLPDGLPTDPSLRDGIPTDFSTPALRPFPALANLLIEAPGEGRQPALATLQAAMFRLLTSLPPGQVKFTIVDPIGIGRNFGAFMHLADFDESLVTTQVWTEPRQIKERLADLSAHMERVTQRYLRNEYASIEEYNAVAEEVAEPYRVVVVADFPTAFDEESAARLASIVATGIPCGVLTLIALDPDRPIPTGFKPADFGQGALRLNWADGRLAWGDPDFGKYPLALDPPPVTEFANKVIQKFGAAARDAKRVEVPFEFIAPAPDAVWTRDSRAGIDVPLGKAGATKRQNMTLGQGTSQHVLIAGRTGSGKSTLLHALITNLALNYSPDEVDLYLIDFKKGVEFKVYATHELPHASVVAIESEREFGISVLQRLDAEMAKRADKFRDAGVQDLNGYRNSPGSTALPRVLLIVDEFQEFFVEDDKVAQDAALLLDRLVRQGRAFGIHVILGSQSLGGAYALARSTLGQMAVRVALQCSEADASLILSEANTAARLLSRPGEAVYNDANGQPEGNHFFQVVWLPDERREAYLERFQELVKERPPALARKPIVFEGDAPAELAQNPLLQPLITAPAWPESPRAARAWLGDPVAIKDPTAAVFRRLGANHLLIVGQNEDMALGINASSLVALAAQYPPAEATDVRNGARFYVLDGTPEDHPNAERLLKLARSLPHHAASGGWREVPAILAEVAAEVERRQQPETDGPEIFLVIHDLPRFRDLRRKADDFGFSSRVEDAGPTDHLATILKEGPGLGVHLMTWCDNLNNLNRVFDHSGLRELGMRVLFQMSQTDSGHLLDAPHASKLGPHRALFMSEEQNRVEKFRPYGVPSEEWVAGLRETFKARSGG